MTYNHLEDELGLVGGFILNRMPIPVAAMQELVQTYSAKTILKHLISMQSDGHELCPVALKHRMERTFTMEGKSDLDAIGGEDMLIEAMENAPVRSAMQGLIEDMTESASRLKVGEIGRWLLKVSENRNLTWDDVAARLLEAAAETSAAIRPPIRSIGEIDHTGGDTGVSTGYSALDAMISTGGYASGQMNVVSAYHKGGKTAFMLSSATLAMNAGLRVLYATFADLDGEQIKRRILRNLCGWAKPPSRIDLLEKYDDAVALLKTAPLDIYDAKELDKGDDVETFAAWLRANADRRGYDIVFVDYAQKLGSSDRKATTTIAEAEICSRVISRLAARTGLPIVIGSQVTEGNEKTGTKTITKGSRVWEEDAGWVLRLKLDKPTKSMMVTSEYNRFGTTGDVPMRWNDERLRVDA